ncbi:hypothetical protein KCU93_g375, partial [Aureobasidium melanogenum]
MIGCGFGLASRLHSSENSNDVFKDNHGSSLAIPTSLGYCIIVDFGLDEVLKVGASRQDEIGKIVNSYRQESQRGTVPNAHAMNELVAAPLYT